LIRHDIHIRPLLQNILSEHPSEAMITATVRYAYRLAHIRLQQQLHSGKLYLQSFSINVEGTAFDCIADLFQRNDEGQFIELLDYFSDERALEHCDEAETQHHFRILVFRKLQDGIIRLYKEHDPILSKTLRNIKLAVQSSLHIHMLDRLGVTYLYTCVPEDRLDHLPEMPMDNIEPDMALRFRLGMKTQEFLTVFFDLLQQQSHYRRFYSVLDLAVLLKRLFSKARIPVYDIVRMDESLLEFDIHRIVNDSIRDVHNVIYTRYVQSQKISEELFHSYTHALSELLEDVFIHNNGSDVSQPEYLKRHIPDLTTEQYRAVHRTNFEYFVRIAKTMTKQRLRELLD
jgi:hypothetical protein